jgi:hypothetical protein
MCQKQPLGIINRIKKSQARRKIWELDGRYHCSILGTCLTLKELRQITRKAKIKGSEKFSDYELHTSFVSVLNEKSYTSRLVNKHLDKKYKRTLQQFSKRQGDQEREQFWKKAVSTGEVAGAFWALISHPKSDDQLIHDIYGKIHMLSHLSGASVRVDMQEFHRLTQVNQQLDQHSKQMTTMTRKKLNNKTAEVAHWKLQYLTLLQKNKILFASKQELVALQNDPLQQEIKDCNSQLRLENERYKTRASKLERDNKQLQQHLEQLQIKHQGVQQKLTNKYQQNQSLQTLLASSLAQQKQSTPSNQVNNSRVCPNDNSQDLCGKCVLYVGGRTGQYSHFRDLVEQYNGRFTYHDGGREDSCQHLRNVVSKADIVLCPLDCVSHSAANAVKKQCKSETKPLVFIPHASLSAFTKGLDTVTSVNLSI